MVLTCRQFVDFLHEFVGGTLAPEARADFDAHLAVCPPCVAYLKTYEQTIRLGKAAYTQPDEPVPSDVPEELVQAILQARTKKP